MTVGILKETENSNFYSIFPIKCKYTTNITLYCYDNFWYFEKSLNLKQNFIAHHND